MVLITVKQLNGAIENRNYGYTKAADKPSPLKEPMFNANGDKYKTKQNAVQSCILLSYCLFIADEANPCYQFLIELSQVLVLLVSMC